MKRSSAHQNGPQDAAAFIAARAPDFTPRVGLILGSGLGGVAEAIDARAAIAYADIPGFPRVGVEGHAGCLILGTMGGVALACLQGRVHAYEGAGSAELRMPVRTLKCLGCDVLVTTNAAGALRPAMPTGSLMVITDHINMLPFNPLTGPNEDAFGPRFPSLDNAYDRKLRRLMHEAGDGVGLKLHDGVYVACLGPSFETPAEVLALSRLGGDAVGMSTVPETIVAVHCGMRVAAISALVSPAAGLGHPATHEVTLSVAANAAEALRRLLIAFFERLAQTPA
jgi:xanthosine phosphorylase